MNTPDPKRKTRKAHQLAALSGDARPTRVIFFDTETTQHPVSTARWQHTLRLGYAQFCRTRKTTSLRKESEILFRKPDEFWDWVETRTAPGSTTYLVAHNLNYDVPVLHAFPEMAVRGFELTSFYTKAMTTILSWRRWDARTPEHNLWLRTGGKAGRKPKAARVIGLDNTNFFQGRLADWGETIKLPKLYVDFSGEDLQLIEYCMRDVEIMRQLWLQWFAFLDENIGGSFSFTLSSQALKMYRRSHLSKTIDIHDDEPALALERRAYRGGRTEMFWHGYLDGDNFSLLDVNSMYPYVMKNNLFPRSLFPPRGGWTAPQLEHYCNNYQVIADVTVETEEPHFPLFVDGEIHYPVGRFKTTLTTPDLLTCFEYDLLREIHYARHYVAETLFSSYVSSLYQARQNYQKADNPLWARLCKMLLNSLYGKFGQRGGDTEEIGTCGLLDFRHESEICFETQEEFEVWFVGGRVLRRARDREHYNSFPAIAAHVTAYARKHLFALAKQAGLEHVYYMDTDSLIVDSAGLENLRSNIHETRLGALKLEHNSDWLMFNAPKDYALRNRTKRKGIKTNALELSGRRFVQTQWSKLAGLVSLETPDFYHTETVVKALHPFTRLKNPVAQGRLHPLRAGVDFHVE